MLEDFIEWYIQSDSLINPSVSDSLSYLEYWLIMGTLGVFAVLFEIIRNAVKNKEFGVRNEWLIGVVLLFFVGSFLKPGLDGIAWLVKKTDDATRLDEKRKALIAFQAYQKRSAELSSEIDTLLSNNGGEWTTGLVQKQLMLWTSDMKMAANLMDATPISGIGSPTTFGGLSLERMLDSLLGGFRGLLKIYYIAMMNIFYLIIPLAYVFSIFKPPHFLKSVGIFLLYGLVLTVLNFIEWVLFEMFLEKTVNTDSIGSMIFSTSAFMYNVLAIFIYLRALYITRKIVPIPEEDQIGPLVGQTLAAATYFAMGKLKMKPSTPPKPATNGAEGGTSGPVDVTTR